MYGDHKMSFKSHMGPWDLAKVVMLGSKQEKIPYESYPVLINLIQDYGDIFINSCTSFNN